MDRRSFLALSGGALAASLTRGATARRPNLIVIFADDLGYGDLGCFGHPTIRTPHLDKMAAEGQKWTQFYACESVCTPSRAGLLTGRLPVRSGMCSNRRRVLFPNSGGGLPATEQTTAEALRQAGYATGMVGKWHLGHLPQYLPTARGFDEYLGIPYSNDMKPCPLLEGTTTIEEPADQTTLTRRYTDRALSFIDRHRDRPFYLYFAHTFPHVPLFASDQFRGASPRGLYGDVVEELDWSVGQILDKLRATGLDRETLVVFTSDNGPWTTQKLNGGSAGLLRGGKGSTWEGGMREPTIAWRPGWVPAATTCVGLGCTLDLHATALALAGVSPPADRPLDGVDLTPALTGGPSPRQAMFYWRGPTLYAVRQGPWKLHFITQEGYGDSPHPQDPPVLYQLDQDPSEQHDVAAANQPVVAELRALAEAHRAGVTPVPSQLEIPLAEG